MIIENPPINLYDPEMFAELNVLMDTMEADTELKVVVFESANPDYFIAHYDLERGGVVPGSHSDETIVAAEAPAAVEPLDAAADIAC